MKSSEFLLLIDDGETDNLSSEAETRKSITITMSIDKTKVTETDRGGKNNKSSTILKGFEKDKPISRCPTNSTAVSHQTFVGATVSRAFPSQSTI